MVRLGLVFVVLLCCVAVSPVSWAMSGGPGGYVYWSTHVPGMPWYRSLVNYDLNRVTIDGNWDSVGPSYTYDNQPAAAAGTGYQFDYFFGNSGVEILDPRDQGGTGKVFRPNVVNDSHGLGYANSNQPWDLVLGDPSNPGLADQLICDGKQASTTDWDTVGVLKSVVAPSSWTTGLPEGTLALVNAGVVLPGRDGGDGTGANQVGKVSFLYDANGNGVIDDSASEGDLVGTGIRPSDVEAGANAVFVSGHKEYLGNDRGGGTIDRYYRNADGTYGKDVYFDYVGTDGSSPYTPLDPNCPVAYSGMGAGIAVAPEETAPIVYMLAHSQAEHADHATYRYMAMFALRDGDGDNVVEYTNPLDTVLEIWSADNLADPTHLAVDAYNQDSALDVELWINPQNGDRVLLFNTNQGELFALELADNGVAVVDGKEILDDMSVSGNTYRLGFELDLNEVTPIPEPATMLLAGTGLLGALGWVRRRRMR